MSNKVSVSKLVAYLKEKNESDSNLLNVVISGELSNVKIYPSNHMYFDLKDDKSKINGVMFASSVKNLNFKPTSGDKVNITGNVKVYQNNATFQIIANKIEKDGFGQLFVEFEKNKKELESKGYFDIKHKKEIPSIPSKIAIIAGHNSAALKDILVTLNTRFKLSQVVAFPSLVQGNKAASDLISTINLVNHYDFDVILLARGGGSFEDLNAFNDVNLAMTIFNSKIPIVTGIGHEVDFTIADFISDFRATTPTAAAIKVSPDTIELNSFLYKAQNQLQARMDQHIKYSNNKIDYIASSIQLNNYSYLLSDKFQSLDYNYNILVNQINNKLNNKKDMLNKLSLSIEKNNIKYKLQEQKQFLLNSIQVMDHALEKKKNNFINKININKEALINTQQNYINQTKNIINQNIISLNLLDPNNILDKGFNIIYKDDVLIKDYTTLKKDDNIIVKGGHSQQLKAIVKEVEDNGK